MRVTDEAAAVDRPSKSYHKADFLTIAYRIHMLITCQFIMIQKLMILFVPESLGWASFSFEGEEG